MSSCLEITSKVVEAAIRRTNTRSFLAQVATDVRNEINPEIGFRGLALNALHEAGDRILLEYFQGAYHNLEASQFRPMAVINIKPIAEFNKSTNEAVFTGTITSNGLNSNLNQ